MSTSHDALCEDLGLSLGTLPYLNVVLGSPWLAFYGDSATPPRADVLGVKPSYTRFCVSIYEVKISRSDFMSDIRSGKWRTYLPHCHRFYFATLPGVCEKSDIPPEAGWMVRGENSWTSRKASPSRAVEIPVQTLQALVFARQRPGVRGRRLDDVAQIVRGRAHDWHTGRQKTARLFGSSVARLVSKARAIGMEVAMERIERGGKTDG